MYCLARDLVSSEHPFRRAAVEHTKRTTGTFARANASLLPCRASKQRRGWNVLALSSIKNFSMQPRCSLESLQQHDHPPMRPLPYAAADAAMRDPAALLFRCKRARLAPLAGSSNLGLTISPSTLLSERPATSDRLPNWPAHELVDRFSRLLRRNSHQHERLELKRAEGRQQRGQPPVVRPPLKRRAQATVLERLPRTRSHSCTMCARIVPLTPPP